MITFCFDYLGDHGIGYPNLAQPGLSPDEFDNTWPKVLPLRLLTYFKRESIEVSINLVDEAPIGAWYPVALAWHDFDCDYFDLMTSSVHHRLRTKEIRVLFYYHEGDHPGRIQQRLDSLCHKHRLPEDCYLFVSANSAAKKLPRCRYFNDHEYFFSYINRYQSVLPANQLPRTAEFTALNRIHKWWRASVMSDLYHHKILERSLWSYNTTCVIQDNELDNPLELDSVEGWRDWLRNFLAGGPYICDHLDDRAHNDHRHVNTDLWTKSYCHLIIETLFDVDNSGGAFLTEKTFKCIKFGQPFVIIGPAGSLEILREQGYKVFDHCIDNSYDLIPNNTQRWLAVKQAIQQIQQQDMHRWFIDCLDDVTHNQEVFTKMNHGALHKLAADLDTVGSFKPVSICPIIDHGLAADVEAGIQQHRAAGTLIPGL